MAINKQSPGPRAGEQRVAFLERRLTRRNALRYGAAGGAAAVATVYASPMIRTVRASAVGATAVSIGDDTMYALGPDGVCITTNSQWGWTNPLVYGQSLSLYAGAGQCTVDKGNLVGSVVLSAISGGTRLTFSISPGEVGEVHVWTGTEPWGPATWSPGSDGSPYHDAVAAASNFTVDVLHPADHDNIIIHGEWAVV